MIRLILLLASGLGAGFSPFAPGTAGTLVAIPIELLLSPIRSPVYELTLLTFFFFSSWIAERAQNHWQKRDDQRIVIDEIMGYFLTMLWIPKTLLLISVGFLLFRLLDIVKPFPCRQLERVRGGFGVVLDDVFAGIYANIALQILRILIDK
jgi:phosphatidylglycerophosphatase A